MGASHLALLRSVCHPYSQDMLCLVILLESLSRPADLAHVCLACVKFARTRACVSSLYLSYLECVFICLFLLLILPILFFPLSVPTLSLRHSPTPLLLSGEYFRIPFSLIAIPP